MQNDFQKAKTLIDQSQSVLLTMHERMDGDDGGSVLAMHHHLEKIGKIVTSVVKQGVPENLSFLPGSHKILEDITNEDFDLIITFGCNEKSRIGIEKIMDLNLPIINFDHHPDNKLFGQINLVDYTKAAVAEIVYDFFTFNGWPINKEVATCLLTGLITDTGSFMHSNTQASTLKAAAQLMRKGAQTNQIAKRAYKNKNLSVLKAWGRAIENSFYDAKHKIVYSILTDIDLSEFSDLPKAAFEGFVETLNAVPEAKFVMFLKQDGEKIKGSLRSDAFKNVDVAKIARLFGGGGHKLAAGFSLAGKLVKDETGEWKIV